MDRKFLSIQKKHFNSQINNVKSVAYSYTQKISPEKVYKFSAET